MSTQTIIEEEQEWSQFGYFPTGKRKVTTVINNPEPKETDMQYEHATYYPYFHEVGSMDSKKFQAKSADVDRDVTEMQKVIDRINDEKIRLLHHSIGVSGEAGELIDTIKKHVFYGSPLDVKNVIEEAGDLMWYLTRLLSQLGYSLEDAMAFNHDKLNKKRYANGYSDMAAVARMDKQYVKKKYNYYGNNQ